MCWTELSLYSVCAELSLAYTEYKLIEKMVHFWAKTEYARKWFPFVLSMPATKFISYWVCAELLFVILSMRGMTFILYWVCAEFYLADTQYAREFV